jgi:signal transduction histidine kinase
VSLVRRPTGPTRPADLVSLAERTAALALVRLAGFVTVLAMVVFDRSVHTSPLTVIIVTTLGAAIAASTMAVGRMPRRAALAVTALSVLIDGLYLGWVVYLTGGTRSGLWVLVYVHVIAVTLLTSSRTGFKVAAWHCLIRLVILYAEAAGYLVAVDPRAALPAPGSPLPVPAMTNIAAVWAIAIVTASVSGVNERELRRQRNHLESLAAMVRRFEAAQSTTEVPQILLDTLCSIFGLARGTLLVSRDGDYAVMAGHGVEDVTEVPCGPDDVTEAAWCGGRPLLVRRFAPEGDRRLHALFPGGRNFIVVPLVTEPGTRLGVVVLERGRRSPGVRRSVIAMIEEFSAHAWLALNNAWLLDDIRDALEENRALRDKLVEQNESLEHAVAERTAEVTERLRELRTVDDARRALLDKLVTAQEEERSRLAGDIHDDPIQKMVATSMRLQMLRRKVNDPEVTGSLEQLLSSVKDSIGSLRHLIFELRPSVLDTEGIAAALHSLMDGLAGEELSYDLTNEMLDEPPSESRVILYRIAQEAIGNVRKHAKTDHVSIALGQKRGGFFVRVSDHGVGFGVADIPVSAPGHLGLTSMRERAELAGGTCQVQSLPGSGTAVEAWVPANPGATGREDRAVAPAPPVPADQIKHEEDVAQPLSA